TKTLAILPQTVTEGQKYLEALGLAVDEVRQARMDSIGLGATPTLVLVNEAGLVTGVWVGKLGVNQQYDVFKHLQIKVDNGLASDESGVTRIDNTSLRQAMERKEHFTLVDVGS